MPVASVVSNKQVKLINAVFGAEETSFRTGRAKYSFHKSGKGVVFKISAKDEVALKAAHNAVNNALNIIQQMESLN